MRKAVQILSIMLTVSWAANAALCAEGMLTPAQWEVVGESVLAALEQERDAKSIPAISMAIVNSSGPVWSGSAGYADAAGTQRANSQTLYRTVAVGKWLTVEAAQQFAADRRLDLDAPLQRYLPTFQRANPFTTPITLRDRLNHRSGLIRDPAPTSTLARRPSSRPWPVSTPLRC